MLYVKFDPTDVLHKSIVGAVPEGVRFGIRLQINQCVAPSRVTMVVYSDDGTQNFEYVMYKDASGEGFDNYLADVQFKKGLYWYYFKMDGVTYEQKFPVAQSGAWRHTKQPQEYPSFEQRREKFCTYDVELQVSYSICTKI